MNNVVRTFTDNLNSWGKQKIPFVFLVDYLAEKPLAWPLEDVNPDEALFDFNGFQNHGFQKKGLENYNFDFQKYPISFDSYKAKFDHVVDNLKAGNSFLANLSVETPVATNLTLFEIFKNSEAPYRFWLKDKFVCFSPEIFVRIDGKNISSFPMKGTIDASIPNAENIILNNPKEAAEHATIVDLIRNDMSMIAKKVWVEKYRYIDRIETNEKALLQVSTQISGILQDDFDGNYGDLLMKLLPAGSITGAPKPSTLKIIRDAEGYERGYYTGVMGYFDGDRFESAVMIRFIENQNGNLVFKSGGGITAMSNADDEYQEIIDKVYLPFAHAQPIMH